MVGVVAFSSQIGNLLSLFGSRAFQPSDIRWQAGPGIEEGGGNPQSIVVSANDGSWLYSIGGLDAAGGHRKNSVYRMKLDENGLPGEWEGSGQGVPQMNFQRAGHRLVEHNGFIYAIAGDIHISETPEVDPNSHIIAKVFPLAYSTIERLDANDPSASWEIFARLTGVHFFPEVLLDGDLLYVIGGIYGKVAGMGGFEEVANSDIFNNKPVIGDGLNGVPLTVSAFGTDGFEQKLSQSVTNGTFVTTVSERYEINLATNPLSYVVAELGLDGGDVCKTSSDDNTKCLMDWNWISARVVGAEMKMGHLRFKLFGDGGFAPVPVDVKPLPQGRYGHKIFKSGSGIYVTGGAVWAGPMRFPAAFPHPEPAVVYPFWPIGDTTFPKTYNGGDDSLTYWNNDFVGNTTYRWNGSVWADWVGTGPEAEAKNRHLDGKYSLKVSVSQGLDDPPVISGLAFIGLGSFDSSASNSTNKLVVGGIRNTKNHLSATSDDLLFHSTVHYYMELDGVSDSFTFSVASGWTPAGNYGYKHFGIDVVDLGSKAVGFGGQPLSYSYPGKDGRIIKGWPQWPLGSKAGETDTQIFNGADWSLSGSHTADRVATAAVVYNSGGDEAVIYRLGGEEITDPWPPKLWTMLEHTDPLTIFNVPDLNTSKFKFVPVDEDGTVRIGGDNHDMAAVIFQLNDFENNPMPGISVGISTENNEDLDLIEKCIPQYSETWGWYCPEGGWFSGSNQNILGTTDENGIAEIFVRSKAVIGESEYPDGPIVHDIVGFWIVGGNTPDNPTGEHLFGDLQLSRKWTPFEPNSGVYFLDENGRPETSRVRQVLSDNNDFAEIEVLLKDGNPITPRPANFYDEYIKLASTHLITVLQTDPPNNLPTADGSARFRVKSGASGTAEIYAWYKPVVFVGVGETEWWTDYTPWISLSDYDLTIQFAGQPGTLTPDSAVQGDQIGTLAANGNATRWLQGDTTVKFINPPEIIFSHTGGFDELNKSQFYSFDINVGSEYAGALIDLFVVEGEGVLQQTSVTADANGYATFRYTTGPAAGIEKIRATIANGQISKELWLTVKHPIDLYTVEVKVEPDSLTSDNQFSIIKARLTSNETGRPITGTELSFSFSNNDSGTLHQPFYDSTTGIVQALYEAGADGRDAEILVEAKYLSNLVIKRISIANNFVYGDPGIIFNDSDLTILSDTELTLGHVNVSDNAEVGFWIFRVITVFGDVTETYDYLFEVRPKIVEGEGFINYISPSVGHRGMGNLSVNITGINTWFNAVENPTVRFTPIDAGQESGIQVVSVSVVDDFDLTADINIADNAGVGYWNVEVVIGSYVYEMPGDFDFLIVPDDPSGYFMNLVVGTYGAGWEPGSLPANGTATLNLTVAVKKFDVWENSEYALTDATINSSIVEGTGELTPISRLTTGGQAAFTYQADTVQGNVETLFESTITDELVEGGEVNLEAAATLAKLATQITFDITVPLEHSRYNYRDSAEIRVVVIKDGSSVPIIDDKFRIDANDKIIGLPSVYVSPSVEYHIWVDPPNHLAVGATFAAPATSQTVSPALTSYYGTRLSYIGDINTGERNNSINAFDYQAFLNQMFKNLLSPSADFNGDGYVNILDWPALFNNYWKQGYVAPFSD